MNWSGVALRFLAALLLVYATFNPEGISFYHWAVAPVVANPGSFGALKFLAGTILFAGWAVYLQATRRSIGWKGALLVLALCAGLTWFLAERHLVNPANGRVITHVGLVVAALILTVGMSWSHVSRRLTGQSDTDVVG